ncbi:MAG: winged helix-turn-helix domain-containing protein [Planctomycetales bacterium]|nr:winged helix-turn-helix domain-containing protein [Planctomycetales bacterium]
MNDTIGQAAGIIWSMLAKATAPINIADIPKKTNLTSQVAYQGLGWLAREGKLEYQQKGRSIYVSLVSAGCTC